jgi:hypothetical protein
MGWTGRAPAPSGSEWVGGLSGGGASPCLADPPFAQLPPSELIWVRTHFTWSASIRWVPLYCESESRAGASHPPAYAKPFRQGHKNDFRDAHAVAEALQRPTTRFVPAKTNEQLDLQALHRVRSRLVSERTAVDQSDSRLSSIVTFGLQRAAGPYRRANSRSPQFTCVVPQLDATVHTRLRAFSRKLGRGRTMAPAHARQEPFGCLQLDLGHVRREAGPALLRNPAGYFIRGYGAYKS